MAELVLSSILQVIVEKLATPVLEKFGTILGVRENVKKLQRTLPMVQALLDDAAEKQATNAAVRIWLAKFKDVAFDAEDLLLRTVGKSRLRWEDANKIKEVVHALEMATDEGLSMNLSQTSCVRQEWNGNESSSFVVESQVYGREEEKGEIVKLLLSCHTTRGGEATCIPIIGMGGLGKTTLAQLAYNNQEVTKHFDVKVWVFVSDHFDVKKIMATVIESLAKDKCHLVNLDALQSEASWLLHNKRYLIVLDDIWTEDQSDWDKLRPLFMGGVDGSKILITTRSKRVALTPDSPTFPYYLKELSEDACWSLFRQRAFHRGEEELHTDLLPIGRQIVSKCGGVALSAKSLGSLMRFKRDVREWEFIRDSELWNLDEHEGWILPALRLSYYRLPLHLKRCFSFCSVFPRNYEFKKEKLIHLWMAQGFIQSSPGRRRREPEDVGSDYFNDLVWMSLFQEVKQRESGVVIGYKMHDVIYDLVKSLTSSEYAVIGHGLAFPTMITQIRHSSVLCDFRSSAIPVELYEASHLRTLLLLSGGNLKVVPDELYSRLQYLFVLDLSGSGLVINGSISALYHLKYLDLSHTPIKNLPHEIELLRSLETFNLLNCYNLVTLPNLTVMRSLRHLNNDGCKALSRMLKYDNAVMTGLQCISVNNPKYKNQLQTLPLFVVGGLHDVILLGSLKLRGSLKVTHLENVETSISALKCMELESLGLYWGSDDGCPNVDQEGETFPRKIKKRKQTLASGSSKGIQPDHLSGTRLLDNFEPHPNLQRLLIKEYPYDLVSWKIPYLKVVHLIDCSSRNLPPLGNLRFLTSLSLREMHEVRFIGDEFYYELNQRQQPFPVLKELLIDGFPNLEQWFSPGTGGDTFPNLRKLILNDCPRLKAVPQISSIKHLHLRDCGATLLNSFQSLTSLETLLIDGVRDLLAFPGTFPSNNPLLTDLEIKSIPQLYFLPGELGNLAALKTLVIRWCENLSSLPQSLRSLGALESLEIGDCHSLLYLPEVVTRGLSNLRSLYVENCNSLRDLSIGFQCLTSLEVLTVMYCPRVVALPSSIEHLSSLRSLSILFCSALEKLPDELQKLVALNSLEIRSCPELKLLPEWIEKLVSLRSLAISDCHNIRSLPEGVNCLTALQHLSIQDCPQLLLRCRKEIGEDWPKIEHVPHKHIESTTLKRPREEGSRSSNY